MSIINHFGSITPTADQLNALQELEMFLNNDTDIFILQGYAGTGKTTLIAGLIDYIKQNGKEFSVMAPTGRAAKILREKTGNGFTIHKSIYNFNNLEAINKESEDEADHSFHYYFPINKLDSIIQHVLIVDESSMISNVESKNELFTFGTNFLLNDLLTYASINTTKNKIIFIGDPAQLPPVNDNKSVALDSDYFIGLGLSVQKAELKEIKRQADNLILKNATSIRNLIESDKRSTLKFEYDQTSFIKTNTFDVVEQFTGLFPKPEIGDGVIISFSNHQSYHYNQSIRAKLFPNQQNIVSADLLLLNSNNYHTYGVELYNGDILKVIHVDDTVTVQSAPVYCSENGVKIRKEINLTFRKITFRTQSHSEDISGYIIDSHLHSINRDLSFNEMRALYINFVMRFNTEQKSRNDRGLPSFKVGSEEFKESLKNDPFFNALRVKFGYAITCHKAQGGEWKQVFVDYYGRVSLKTDPLRWCYTATTRAIETLYAINPPNFGNFTQLKFSSIGKIGTLPLDSLDLSNIVPSPFHSTNAHKAKSLKYWDVLEKIENTDFQIENLESRDYLERYTLKNNDSVFQIEGHHKGSGHFVDQFKVISGALDSNTKEQIESIFNDKLGINITPNYHPKKPFLEELYTNIQSICLDLSITVTNVVENKNYVNYYFVTDSICSYIQFYFNDKDLLTTAMPKTFECIDDNKLTLLIEKLKEYVI
jgi:hypothetical protein